MKLIRFYIVWWQVLKKLISLSNIKLCQNELHHVLWWAIICIYPFLILDEPPMFIEELFIVFFRSCIQLLLYDMMLSLICFIIFFSHCFEEDHKAIIVQGFLHSTNCIFSIILVQVTKAPTSINAHVLAINPVKVLDPLLIFIDITRVFISHFLLLLEHVDMVEELFENILASSNPSHHFQDSISSSRLTI